MDGIDICELWSIFHKNFGIDNTYNTYFWQVHAPASRKSKISNIPDILQLAQHYILYIVWSSPRIDQTHRFILVFILRYNIYKGFFESIRCQYNEILVSLQ